MSHSSALIAGCGYLGLRVAKSWQQQGVEAWAITRSQTRSRTFAERSLRPIVLDLAAPEGELPAVDTVLWSVGFDRSANVPREKTWIDGLRWLVVVVVTITAVGMLRSALSGTAKDA